MNARFLHLSLLYFCDFIQTDAKLCTHVTKKPGQLNSTIILSDLYQTDNARFPVRIHIQSCFLSILSKIGNIFIKVQKKNWKGLSIRWSRKAARCRWSHSYLTFSSCTIWRLHNVEPKRASLLLLCPFSITVQTASHRGRRHSGFRG